MLFYQRSYQFDEKHLVRTFLTSGKLTKSIQWPWLFPNPVKMADIFFYLFLASCKTWHCWRISSAFSWNWFIIWNTSKDTSKVFKVCKMKNEVETLINAQNFLLGLLSNKCGLTVAFQKLKSKSNKNSLLQLCKKYKLLVNTSLNWISELVLGYFISVWLNVNI